MGAAQALDVVNRLLRAAVIDRRPAYHRWSRDYDGNHWSAEAVSRADLDAIRARVRDLCQVRHALRLPKPPELETQHCDICGAPMALTRVSGTGVLHWLCQPCNYAKATMVEVVQISGAFLI